MLERMLSRAVQFAGILLFSVLFVTLFLSVLVRYFNIFQGSMAWVEESSRYLFVWVSFLGAVLAMEQREHISIDVLVRLLPAKLRRWYEAGIDLAVLIFLVVITWYGVQLAVSTPHGSPALRLPLTAVYASIPITGTLMAVFLILTGVRRWRRGLEERSTPDGSPRL